MAVMVKDVVALVHQAVVVVAVALSAVAVLAAGQQVQSVVLVMTKAVVAAVLEVAPLPDLYYHQF
ncbi:MAG: hypothetical protein IPG85_14995 [Bacteroidetes bacterium]|nr:hypothetical protein [Bacteroidota bacterium]